MSVFFERGPQKDETKRFLMQKETTEFEINEKFKRVSTFYYEKQSKKWQEKFLCLNLGFYVQGKFNEAGRIQINMADMVNEGEKKEVYSFPAGSVASHFDAKLHVSLEVVLDTAKLGPRASTMASLAKGGSLFASSYDKGTKVAKAASDVMDKVEAT